MNKINLKQKKHLTWYKKIQILRMICNLTQREAAELCKTNQKVFWCWENGKNYPRKENQILIAKALDSMVEEIFPI